MDLVQQFVELEQSLVQAKKDAAEYDVHMASSEDTVTYLRISRAIKANIKKIEDQIDHVGKILLEDLAEPCVETLV